MTESGYGVGDTPEEPTPTEYEQLLSIANATKQVAQSVRTDADSGVFKGDKGDVGEVNTEQMNTALSQEILAEQKRTNNVFANALKATASGSVVCIDDVSPNEHTLEVTVRNKNLIPYALQSGTIINGIT